MGTLLIGCDTETDLINAVRRVPPLVCMTLSCESDLKPLLKGVPGVLKLGPREGIPHNYLLDRDGAIRAWPRLLEHNLVIHNASFDLPVMMDATGLIEETFVCVDENRVWDTLHREKLIANSRNELQRRWDPFTRKMGNASFSLDTLVMRYLGVDIRAEKKDPASWRLRYADLLGIPLRAWPADAVEYAVMDAVYALRVLQEQEMHHEPTLQGIPTRDAENPDRFAGEWQEVQASLALTLQAIYGLRTDPERVRATLDEWRRIAAKGNEIGLAAGFLSKKGDKVSRDMPTLQQMVAEAYGFKGVLGTPQVTKKNGQPNPRVRTINGHDAHYDFTPENVREQYPDIVSAPSGMYPEGQVRDATEVLRDAPYGSGALRAYSESKQAINFIAKWADTLQFGATNPITYSVDSLKSTGRTGARKPAVQQPPKTLGFRECFVPRPGFLFAGADYGQIEMRCWAQVCEEWGLGSTLADALRAGKDPHCIAAKDILNAEGSTQPNGKPWTYKAFLTHKREPEMRAARTLAKALNFGLMGGLGARTFVEYAWKTYEIEITLERAQELKALWVATWPEARGYFAEISGRLHYAETFTAQTPVTGMLRGGLTYTNGCNTFFQGYAAVGFKAAAWDLACEMYVDCGTALFGSRAVLPLHDEYILEVPRDRAPEAADRLAEVMRDTMQRHVPDIPIEVEPVLMERWYKQAETVRDDAGRLQVWRPE